jgi:hypothetical protein
LIDNPVMADYRHTVYTYFLTDRGINAFSDDAITSFFGCNCRLRGLNNSFKKN